MKYLKIKLIVMLIIISCSYAENMGIKIITGKVSQVNDQEVQITVLDSKSIQVGDSVQIFFHTLSDEEMSTGTWEVVKIDNHTIFAKEVDKMIPPKVGFIAKITISPDAKKEVKKKGERVSDQAQHQTDVSLAENDEVKNIALPPQKIIQSEKIYLGVPKRVTKTPHHPQKISDDRHIQKNNPMLYVCYSKKTMDYHNNKRYPRYYGCKRSNISCMKGGLKHFGKYPNQSRTSRALQRCIHSIPKFVDPEPKSSYRKVPKNNYVKNSLYVCYSSKEIGYRNGKRYPKYWGCRRSRVSCGRAGLKHFGKYANQRKASLALQRCIKSTPKFID